MINIGVFFGGRSVEHEVSVISAIEAMHALDKEKYEVIPVYISKQGQFYTGKQLMDIASFKDMNKLLKELTKINIEVNSDMYELVAETGVILGKKVVAKIDVAFPIMHGTNCEDGTIQGLFELMNIPYVGCNIVASANGMDKVTMKMILKESGLPVVDYVWFYTKQFSKLKANITEKIETELGYPVIVKPANLGSSVGISKANNPEELEEAINYAGEFAKKIIVEKAVQNLREINCSVIGDYEEQDASVCEEPVRSEDILSYKDKYMGGAKGSKTGGKGMSNAWSKIPADLTEGMTKQIQLLAKQTFIALDASGVSRIDFLIDDESKMVYVNEINTIPGSLSFYLWEKTKLPYHKLLDKLITLALKKQREKEKLIFTNEVNILELTGKSGAKVKEGIQ